MSRADNENPVRRLADVLNDFNISEAEKNRIDGLTLFYRPRRSDANHVFGAGVGFPKAKEASIESVEVEAGGIKKCGGL